MQQYVYTEDFASLYISGFWVNNAMILSRKSNIWLIVNSINNAEMKIPMYDIFLTSLTFPSPIALPTKTDMAIEKLNGT